MQDEQPQKTVTAGSVSIRNRGPGSVLRSWIRQRGAVVIALCVGLAAAWCLGFRAPPNIIAGVGVLVVLAIAVAAPSRRGVSAAALSFERWGRRRPQQLALVVGLGGGLVLYGLAWAQGRDVSLRWQDEFSYAVQAQIFAEGRLWMPEHPLGDALRSLYLINGPVYTSIYFPGTALLHTPGVWLGLPVWVTALALASVAVAGVCRLAARWGGPLAGVLAAVLLVSTVWFRLHALIIMSQIPTLALAAWLFNAWAGGWRARSGYTPIGLLVMGALAGLLVITRPVDAAAIVAPVAVAVAWRSGRTRGVAGVTWAVLCVSLAAAPFLALQGVINHAVTGEVTGYPHAAWVAENFPDAGFGFGPVTDTDSASALPHVRRFYEFWISPQIIEHRTTPIWTLLTEKRLPVTLYAWMPLPWLLALLAVGLWARPQVRLVLLASGFFVFLYTFSGFYMWYYPVAVATGPIVAVALGAAVSGRRGLVGRRRWAWIPVAGTTVLAISMWPVLNPQTKDDPDPVREIVEQNRWEQVEVQTPALIIFRDPGGRSRVDPVYNVSTAWPDDAPIVRAHDLGSRNLHTLAYYASLQPDRKVYLVDRKTRRRFFLGPVTEAYAALLATEGPSGQ